MRLALWKGNGYVLVASAGSNLEDLLSRLEPEMRSGWVPHPAEVSISDDISINKGAAYASIKERGYYVEVCSVLMTTHAGPRE